MLFKICTFSACQLSYMMQEGSSWCVLPFLALKQVITPLVQAAGHVRPRGSQPALQEG